jgi:hypothetical protein
MLNTPSFTLCRIGGCRTTPEPGYADRGLCTFHEAEGLDAIATLYGDWCALQPLIWDKLSRPAANDTGPSPFGPSLPLDEGADALAREIAYTAVVWEIAVRDRAQLSDAPHQQAMATGADLLRATNILHAHYSVLVALGPVDYVDYQRNPNARADGPDAVVALMGLHRRASAWIGIVERVETLPGECPQCHWPTVRHRTGGEDVHCSHCRAVWTWDEYQDLAGMLPLAGAA